MLKKLGIFMMTIFASFFILTACSSGNEEESTDANNESNDAENNDNNDSENGNDKAITVEDLEGNTVEFSEPPERIVPLSAGDAETIYSLDEEIVGKPVMRGDVPEYMEDVPDVGTSNDVDMEEIADLDPDLVIAHPQLNAEDIPALEEMGIDVLMTGADTIDEIEDSIDMLGKVLEQEDEADELVDDIDTKIDELAEEGDSDLKSMIIFGSPGNFMIALPNSLSGDMLDAIGGNNIAEDYPELDEYPQYAQIDVEKIIESDPEAIFFISPADSEEATAAFSEEMEQNPAWDSVDAVENDHFIELPNELFGASPGSKIVDSLEYFHDELQSVEKD